MSEFEPKNHKVVLKEYDGKKLIPVNVVSTNNGIDIHVDGYGVDKSDTVVLVLEYFAGKLQVRCYNNKTGEPVAIDLEGAKIS